MAAGMDNAIWANQCDNIANRDAHYATTGPEVWAQTNGSVNAFVAATGTSRVTANLEATPIEDACLIEIQEAVICVYRLLRDEGLFLGSSSGINVAAAVRVARELGPGHRYRPRFCMRWCPRGRR